MIYKWKFQPKGNVPAQEAGKELERLTNESGGKLTAEYVVLASTPEDSVLHNCFEWDDDVAASKYREHQAQYIITQLVVVDETKKANERVQVRAFVSIENDETFYTTIESAMNDVGMRNYLLKRAYKDLQDWRQKYKDLKEFAEVFTAVDGLDI